MADAVENFARSVASSISICSSAARSTASGRRDYSRLVDWMNDAMRRSLSRVTRDEAARVLWHICRTQPRLLLVGLRGLLNRTSLVPPERD